MKYCIECNHEFTMFDRIKSVMRLTPYLKCTNCNLKYKPVLTIYRWLYNFLVILASLQIFTNVEFNSMLLKYIVFVLILTFIFMLYDVFPHKWHKYKKID